MGSTSATAKPLLAQMSIVPPSRGDPVGDKVCDRRPSTRRYKRGPHKGEDSGRSMRRDGEDPDTAVQRKQSEPQQ